MPQTQFQRVTDLSRLNWKGGLLLLVTIVVMFASIIVGGLQAGGGGLSDNRRGRKFLGFIFALLAFGGFILSAVGLRKIGVSIWKDGMDPYAEQETDSGSSWSESTTRVGVLVESDSPQASPIDSAADLPSAPDLPIDHFGSPIDPTDIA